jgi:hypothetical protein
MHTPRSLGLLLALAAATPAFAGNKQTHPVSVTINGDGSGQFSGSIGDARASADANQFIGCSFTGSTVASGYCYAVDAAGRGDYCLLNSTVQQTAVGTIGPSSWIQVSWDARNNCEFVRVDNFSYNRPVAP